MEGKGMAKAKKETVSLQEAAEAFILLHDSGNYNGRRYDRVLGMLRDAVKKDGDSNYGPIVPEPEDAFPELDEEQQAAADELIFKGARVEDLVHPGGRLQKGREALDTILKEAEEGTLALDGGRKLAADAKEAAEKAQEEAADVQKVTVVDANEHQLMSAGPSAPGESGSETSSKKK
jgi:hypothetical protein